MRLPHLNVNLVLFYSYDRFRLLFVSRFDLFPFSSVSALFIPVSGSHTLRCLFRQHCTVFVSVSSITPPSANPDRIGGQHRKAQRPATESKALEILLAPCIDPCYFSCQAWPGLGPFTFRLVAVRFSSFRVLFLDATPSPEDTLQTSCFLTA